jgi:hypothetical protein
MSAASLSLNCRLDPKIPNDAPAWKRSPPAAGRASCSSPLQVVMTPVGPTGGDRPQARASRVAASEVTARPAAARIAGIERMVTLRETR